MSNIGTSFWTVDRVQLAQRLWREGYTATQIAAHVGAGCTRASIIGVAWRRKWPRDKLQHASQTRHKRIAYANPSKAVVLPGEERPPKGLRRLPAKKNPSVALPYLPEGETFPAPICVAIFDLTSSTCHWPMGNWSRKDAASLKIDPPTEFFCGAPALQNGSPYCAAHSRAAYEKAGDRARTVPAYKTVFLPR